MPSSTEGRLGIENGDLVADFADADFVAIHPFPHPIQRAVMPVVAMKDDYVRGIGTCFAISSQGLILTARHVIEDALQIDAGGESADPDLWIGALYAAETGEDNRLGGLLPASKVYFNDDLDLALMHLSLPTNGETGKALHIPALRLGTRIPRGGEQCAGFRLHPLKGDRAGQWSVRVSGNWRVVFRFEDGEAVDVDLIDYHRHKGSDDHEWHCERSRRHDAEPAAPG